MARLALMCSIVVFLGACGGGGSNSPGNQPPPVAPDPPDPAPAQIPDPGIELIYPFGIEVIGEGVLDILGLYTFRGAEEDYAVIADAGAGEVVADYSDAGSWTASGVHLSADELVSLRIFARDNDGAESAGYVIEFPRSSDWLVPLDIIGGIDPTGFLLEFPDNELRSYDGGGMELGRQQVPDGGAAQLSNFTSWPATGEVLQVREFEDPRTCSLVAYRLSDGHVRTIYEVELDRPFPSCGLHPVVDGQVLYLLGAKAFALLSFDTEGQVVNELPVESLAGLVLPDPLSEHLLSLLPVTLVIDALQIRILVTLRRIDVHSGEVTELFRSGEEFVLKGDALSGITDVTTVDDKLFFYLSFMPYTLDLNSMVLGQVAAEGDSLQKPRRVARIKRAEGMLPGGSEERAYVIDYLGRVLGVDLALGSSEILTDAAPGVPPLDGF